MSKPIVGANRSKLTNIDITLPVDEDGEFAFDEDGKAIKGKTPVVLSIPRYDVLDREQFKALKDRLSAVSEELPLEERVYAELIAGLEGFVTEEQLLLVETRPLFEVKQIRDMIREANQMTVGELLASTRS